MTNTVLNSATFLREAPVRSMQQDMMFSNTASTVENAANAMNTKNRLPHKRPIGMWLKILGRVTKIRFGPLSGETPNAKHAGKMIKPAVNATNVSRMATLTASPMSARPLPI